MYENIIESAENCRKLYKDGIDAYIKRLENGGNEMRKSVFSSSDFLENIEKYREKYIRMLGLDKIESENVPTPMLTKIGECEDGLIYSATVFVTLEIPMYGLLFVPHGILGKAPLVIVQHGGGGTPELCSDLHGKNNYNRIVRRILKRGAVVFAPQLLLWNCADPLPTAPTHNVKYERSFVDNALKRFGMSITALEIKGIMRAIDYLVTLPCVDPDKIGMTGCSYGGYFTLHTMAADVRIKAGFSNACFNDRNAYPWRDWSYKNSGNTFHDAEIAALCAPRRLYVAIGKEDTVFDYKTAIPEAERAKEYFDACGCSDNFVFQVWDGGHTVPDDDYGFDFLFSAFK